MIILLGNGRLGNQLFQFSFAKNEFPSEKIILVGFDDAATLCDLGSAFIVPRKYFGKITYMVFRGAIALLGTVRLISSIEEDASGPDFKIIKRYGLFFNIILIKNSYFQHEKFTNALPANLEIKSQHLSRAKSLISQAIESRPKKELVFIHVRRGDYVEWPSTEFPAVLSAQWICDAMEYFRAKLGNPLYLIFTDDKQYVDDVFACQDDIISLDSEGAANDLAVMSLCNYGILSASTFSWWAANFSRKKLSQKQDYEFIAPNFWAGHASNEWFPPYFYTQWLTYLPVKR